MPWIHNRLDGRYGVVAGRGCAGRYARPNAARYFKNKLLTIVFTVEPASEPRHLEWVHRILKEEREWFISSRTAEATPSRVAEIRGLTYSTRRRTVHQSDGQGRRASEASGRFSSPTGWMRFFVFPASSPTVQVDSQKSSWAGTIRGSNFVIKNAADTQVAGFQERGSVPLR